MSAFKKTFFIIMMLCTANLFAQEDDVRFSFGFDSGLINGSINEYVFDIDSDEKSYTMSRLDWDIVNLKYFGCTLGLDVKHLHADLNCKGGIPDVSGAMNDYDWLDYSDHTKLTNHSWHSNSVDSYIKADFNAGWTFYLPAEFTITPLLSYSYEYIGFTGSDGAYKYLNNDGITFREGTFNGPVISYTQSYDAFRAGLNVNTLIIPSIDLGLSFFVSPVLNIDAVDTHVIRKICFWDNMTGGIMYEGNGHLFVDLSKLLSFGLTGGIQYVPVMSGETRSKNIKSSKWGYPDGTGGTKRLLWHAGIELKLNLN